MDTRYNQQYGYAGRPNTQHPPQQPQNGYQQYGQAPQYPQQYQQQYPPAQMHMHHGYPQQTQHRQPQAVIPQQQSQQYMQMPQPYSPQRQYQQQEYQQLRYQQIPQQQLQYQRSPQQQYQQSPQQQYRQSPQQQQQQQYQHAMQPQPRPQAQSQHRPHPHPEAHPHPQNRAQPQVVIPQRAPTSTSYSHISDAQTSSPNIRQAQVPSQRTSNADLLQMDGSQDMYRRQSTQQVPTPNMSRPVQQPGSQHKSVQRLPQITPSTPTQAWPQQQQPQPRPSQAQVSRQIELPQPHHQAQVRIEQQPRPVLQVQPTSQHTSSQSDQQTRPVQTPTQGTTSHQTQVQQSTPAQTTKMPQKVAQYTSSQQSNTQKKSHAKVVIPLPPSHQLTSPTKATPAQLPQKSSPADLSILLISAADEYIAAARSIGMTIARHKKNSDVRQYYKLMSTAMGCMDAALRKFNMQPRDEARLRLRYASLLIEETDNTSEIDEILSKGISLCARCRLQDLRYSMLHLQARYQFQTNHRAAFKALEKNISEAETFQQIAWVYAFRFLKVSLLLQSTDRLEAIPALQQLHAIAAYAEKRDDTAVAFACYVLEAMIHLRSSAQDRLIEAQRAIAQARSLQLTMSTKQQGTFGTLFNIVDLACSVHQSAPDRAKSTALIQATADENDSELGTDNGVFTVTLNQTVGGSLTTDTGGIFRRNAEGRDELVFTWLPREDIKALCFYICALDQSVHEKALQLVQEARSRSRESMRRQPPFSLSISMACAQTQWRKVLDWHATFTLGLIATQREDHATATDTLGTLTKRVTTAPYASQPIYTRSLSYLEAVIDQTNGRFNTALATYSSDAFVLTEKIHVPSLTSELSILGAMNRLLITRDPAHIDHENVGSLLSQLRLACEEHPSQYVRMAFNLVNALCTLDPSINRLKTLMNNATQKSHDLFKRTQNREFVVMSLCYFTARFFIEPVTDKSSSAANAVRQHAKQSNRPLWMAVACGLMIKVFEHNNSVAEKQKYEEVYEKVRVKLPAPLRGDDVDAEGEDDDDDDYMDLVR